jgi:HK97 family phage portal protein
MARKSIGLGMAMETFGSRYFGEGTHPGLVVTHPGWNSLSVESRKNMRDALNETYQGLGKTHRLMFLDEAMKVEKIGIPPEDSQFLESRQFQIPEIARWFNLPPHKLKDLTKSSFNNIEQEQISFVTDSILPWLIRLEQNYSMQLLTDAQRKRGNLYFKHIVEGLLRADAKSRAEFYKTMIQATIMTPNEAREKEDMNPSDDPLADELWAMTNMMPLSKMDGYMASKIPGQSLPEPGDGSQDEPTQPAGKLLEFKNKG